MAESASRNKLKWVLETFFRIIRIKVRIIRKKWKNLTLALSPVGFTQESQRSPLVWEELIGINGSKLNRRKRIIIENKLNKK